MRIGIVTPSYYPYPGGVPEHVYHTYAELTKLGHRVRVVTTSFGPGTAPNEGDVIRIGRAVSVPANGSMCPVAVGVRLREKVRRVLDAEGFDILHVHEPLMPALCLAVVREAQVPVVGTFHANNEDGAGYRVFKTALAPRFAKLSARIAVSEAARRTVERHFGGEYTIIPNGVAVERFAGAEPIENLVDGSLNVLFVGRLEPRKGAKFLFKALPLMLDRIPSLRLIVVGSGPLGRYYRSYVRGPSRAHVLFTGRVPGDMLARYYRTADVFCSPATGGESFGIVLLEAMAAGAAVVASDIPGYRAVVTDGETGLLVEPRNPAAIADAIACLGADDVRRRGLVESAREDVRRYSWDRVTGDILRVYETVLSGGGKRTAEVDRISRDHSDEAVDCAVH